MSTTDALPDVGYTREDAQRDAAIMEELERRGFPSSTMNAARAGWYAALAAQAEKHAAELAALKQALHAGKVCVGRLAGNPPLYVPECDALRAERDAHAAAIQEALDTNGGPIDSSDTVDGHAYVMVRRDAFDALAARTGGKS